MLIKQSRIIIDTNLWISYLISTKFVRLDKLIFNNNFKLIFSTELIDEFIDVSNRSKFLKYFSREDIIKLLELFDVYAEMITVTSKIKICRDMKDNFLLSLSIDGNVDFLITGDTDLLELKSFGKTKILTISEFEFIHKINS